MPLNHRENFLQAEAKLVAIEADRDSITIKPNGQSPRLESALHSLSIVGRGHGAVLPTTMRLAAVGSGLGCLRTARDIAGPRGEETGRVAIQTRVLRANAFRSSARLGCESGATHAANLPQCRG